MANLVVTFSRKNESAPLDGARARTQSVTIGAGNTRTTIAAGASDGVVSLLAEADCWYCISDGASSDATDTAVGANRRPLLAGQRAQHAVSPGDTVACVQKV